MRKIQTARDKERELFIYEGSRQVMAPLFFFLTYNPGP